MNNQNNNGNKKKKYYQHYNNHYNNKNKNKKNKKFYYYQNQHKKHNNYQQYKKNDNNINNNYQNEIKEDIVDDREYLERDNDKKLEENFFEDINHDDFEDNEYLEKQDFLKKKEEQEEIKLDDLILEETIGLDVNKIEKQKEFSKSNENQIEVDDYQEDVKVKPDRKFSLVIYIIGTILVLAVLSAVSYAWFNYYQEGSHEALAEAGTIYVKLDGNTRTLSLSKLYPTQTDAARAKNDNYVDFTILGMNTSPTKDVFYNITVSNGDAVSGKTRINPQYLLFDLSTLDASNNETRLLSAVTFNELNNASLRDLKVAANTTEEISQKYRIRMWIKGDLLISDTETGAAYTQNEFNNLYASIKVEVSTDIKEKETGSEKVLAAITEHATGTCQNITYDEDGVTYLSGTNDCINFNYVWYSGKLWRITAIYPDGTMKMVTEDALTTISWGSTIEYDGSWVYQWLNEDFYDTLVNPNDIIISNATWNYSTDGNSTPVKPETIETQKTITAPIGLLNAYEYYNACRKASASTNYLNIGYYWWLITPYSTSNVRSVYNFGNLNNFAPAGRGDGVRPSVNLKSGLEFTGDGSKSSPYKIKDDMKSPINNVTLLSSRSVGEYVKFDDNLYRIVDTSDGITKLTRVDYLRDSGTVISKNFASTVYFGKSSNTQTDTYWDYYLNNNWYNSISSTYQNMLVDGTYYLGLYPSNTNYKATICKDATLDNITTNNCTKYTASDTDKIFTGKVGLPRVGEMFSAQLGNGFSSSSPIWTITPYSASDVRDVFIAGFLNYFAPAGYSLGVRPSINLKSGIKITKGTGYVGGETNSPFEIACDDCTTSTSTPTPVPASSIASCPGCKFMFATNTMYTTWNTQSQTPTVVDPSTLSSNYEDVVTSSGYNTFLGLKLNNSNQITNAYACGLKDGVTPFCIEGTVDGSKYNDNVTLLQSSSLWNGECTDSTSYSTPYLGCSGSVRATAYSDGSVDVLAGVALCNVGSRGVLECVVAPPAPPPPGGDTPDTPE